ncbi:MAG TPA: acylphosphatase [Candidatus Udaeobacter sp.]|nr:acylphosphatase [Candidatus Udaeobacter sp.]
MTSDVPDGASERAARFIVTGRVQGVGFRFATAREARALGVRGWVRNLPDGRVEGLAEGISSAVAALLTFCRQGPLGARVDQLQVEDLAPGSAGDRREFQIRP